MKQHRESIGGDVHIAFDVSRTKPERFGKGLEGVLIDVKGVLPETTVGQHP
jgi:hypothetical protein